MKNGILFEVEEKSIFAYEVDWYLKVQKLTYDTLRSRKACIFTYIVESGK